MNLHLNSRSFFRVSGLAVLALFLLTLGSNIAAQSTESSIPVQGAIFEARDQVMSALVHIQPVVKDYRTGELKKQSVVGSGVVFHPDGYVVTNYHVAGKSERIICTLADKEQVPAEYIGGDPPTDIAVLKLQLPEGHPPLTFAEFGNSDEVQVGQYVMALGSPLALARSVSLGVVSTKDRYFSGDYRLPSGERTGKYNLWIQTDAAINPGNSGGPLVDLQGHVVGINSRATFFANNLGFAIPVNVVKKVVAAILDHGEVDRSWIGVHAQALQELEDFFGADRNTGVLVSSVDPGSPAEEVLLKAGDIITEIAGEPVSARFVEELPAFYDKIASHKPGSTIDMKVLRNDETYELHVVSKPLGELQGTDFECSEWGCTVKDITRQMAIENQLDDTLGVFVTGVKRVGAADLGGLISGDVITSVNRVQIVSLDDFRELYENLVAEAVDKILLTVFRAGGVRLIVLDVSSKDTIK